MAKDELTFLEFFQSHRRGELIDVADKLLVELMEAVRDTGGKGEIDLKLSFKVNDAGQTECAPSVTMKKPRRPIGVGIYYITDNGRLTRRDPGQADMFDELETRRDRGN